MGVLTDVATELPATGLAVEPAQQVSGHVVEIYAPLEFALDERKYGPEGRMPGFHRRCLPEKLRIDTCQQPGVVVGLPAQPHAVGMPQVLVAFSARLVTVVDTVLQISVFRMPTT